MVLGSIDICSDSYCVKFKMIILVLYINYIGYARYNEYEHLRAQHIIKGKIMICI